jgi:transcriptional regulator with XRE-family HTH domain
MVVRANTVLCDGVKVRQARHLKGWSQEGLAEKAGIRKSTVERMERGKPTYVTTLDIVAQTLNVQIKDLLLTDETGPQTESRPESNLQEIEHNLKEKLRTEARSHLAEKLHNRECSYHPLAMEIGSVPDRQTRGSNLLYRETQPCPEDHN